MKYLDLPLLTQLSHSLSATAPTDTPVNVRFEAYSVKPVGREKRAFKEREEAYISEQEGMEEMSFSPEMREAGLASCFGRLDEKESRKVHFLLVSTLNSAFPDHDFSSLRPDHFTREPNSAQVLAYLSGSLLGSLGNGTAPIFLPMALNSRSPQSSPSLQPHSLSHSPSPYSAFSPSSFPNSASNASSLPSLSNLNQVNLYRVLNQVIPLDDCDVYSFFPEPEYDPHMDPLEEADLMEEDEGMDADGDAQYDEGEPAWGTGMDLDVEMEMDDDERPKTGSTSRNNGETWGDKRRAGGLLWSANYFFYSKRQKRILFLTSWCRHLPSGSSGLSGNQADTDIRLDGSTPALPLPITASISPSSLETRGHPTPLKARRGSTSAARKARHPPPIRKSLPGALNIHPSTSSSASEHSTIPIRGISRPPASPSNATHVPSTPRAERLVSSAPNVTSLGFTATPSSLLNAARDSGKEGGQSPMARMKVGGFKPRQTPARMVINARATQQPTAEEDSSSAPSGSGSGGENGNGEEGGAEKRRDRSESTTPGPSSALTAGLRAAGAKGTAEKGKRVKV
ncbi:hypothetical protein L202_06476 [Cryptococcus amylolentus CBS 6039]|uniref:Uncharacterized protein n=2 Tax=Cryptococcus amylolentus CBS 6039 TaxID=1295533 RepID=A0A1E3HG05_9TREE|nr:hypothetical protein L202_06476 [Cryptococcus amylolentus CBS 6039]ODN75293.1 hypothetical protein L202_06476 [Cryptococcus amylolentus CBS 6039]